MVDYIELKKKIIRNKLTLLNLGCFIVIFIIGFGSGSAEKALSSKNQKFKTQPNYSKNAAEKPDENLIDDKPVETKAAQKQAAETPERAAECNIKGNISAKGDKIYHIKGGAFYTRVKAEQCFVTETDAKAAGFRKSSR